MVYEMIEEQNYQGLHLSSMTSVYHVLYHVTNSRANLRDLSVAVM
jgi:hypothetical protein